MITQEKIDRINALAKKAKSPEGLTPEEQAERTALRREYIDAFKQSLTAQLHQPVKGLSVVFSHGLLLEIQIKDPVPILKNKRSIRQFYAQVFIPQAFAETILHMFHPLFAASSRLLSNSLTV